MAPEKIRVAYVISDLRVGGAERLLADMLAYWASEGAPVLPQVFSLRDGPIRGLLEESGCPVRVLPAQWHLDPRPALWLRDCFRSAPVDLAHLHLPRAAFFGRLASRWLGLPVLYTEHNRQEVYHPLTRLAQRLTYPLNSRVAAVSEAVLASLLRETAYPREKATLLYSGIVSQGPAPSDQRARIRRSLTLPPEAIVLGAVANLHPRKGLRFLVQATRELLPEFPALRCAIVGREDGDGPALRALAAQCGLAERVRWLGFRADARDLLPAFNVFVNSSLFEGLPVSVLEAMDASLPVVATRVGGNPELIVEGETGLLVPPEDPRALAQAIRGLLLSAELRGRMGRAGKERAQRQFSLAAMAARYLELYREILEEHARN